MLVETDNRISCPALAPSQRLGRVLLIHEWEKFSRKNEGEIGARNGQVGQRSPSTALGRPSQAKSNYFHVDSNPMESKHEFLAVNHLDRRS
jgi:hypothetical protein